MATPERKILVPDGDRVTPHPSVVCSGALRLKNEIVLIEDLENGRKVSGRVSRRIGVFSGCLIEIIPSEFKKETF